MQKSEMINFIVSSQAEPQQLSQQTTFDCFDLVDCRCQDYYNININDNALKGWHIRIIRIIHYTRSRLIFRTKRTSNNISTSSNFIMAEPIWVLDKKFSKYYLCNIILIFLDLGVLYSVAIIIIILVVRNTWWVW